MVLISNYCLSIALKRTSTSTNLQHLESHPFALRSHRLHPTAVTHQEGRTLPWQGTKLLFWFLFFPQETPSTQSLHCTATQSDTLVSSSFLQALLPSLPSERWSCSAASKEPSAGRCMLSCPSTTDKAYVVLRLLAVSFSLSIPDSPNSWYLLGPAPPPPAPLCSFWFSSSPPLLCLLWAKHLGMGLVCRLRKGC